LDLPLPFTDSPGEAQRLANIALERNRSQLTLTGAFGLQAFALQVGDIVNITNTRLGFSNKIFEVVQWSFGIVDGGDLQTNLTLRETTTTTYDEYQDVAFESDNTTLPGVLGPTVIAGSGDVNSTTDVTGLTASGGVREIYVNWTNPINNTFSYTKIYYDSDSGISGASQQNVTGESFVLTGLSANDTRYFWAQAYDSSNNTLGSQVGPVSATVKDITTGDIEINAVDTNQLNTSAVTTIKIQEDAISTTTLTEDLNNSTRAFDETYNFTMDSAGTITAFAYIKVNGNLSAGTDGLVCRLYLDGTLTGFFQAFEEEQVTGGQTLIGSKDVTSGSKAVRVDVDVTGLATDAFGPIVHLYLVVTRTYR